MTKQEVRRRGAEGSLTKARVEHLRVTRLLGGSFRFAFRRACDMQSKKTYPDGITLEEDALIKARWETMPGWTTYEMALLSFGRDPAEDQST